MIDKTKCPKCGKFKKPIFPYCFVCNKTEKESSPKWDKADASATEFYCYVLQLADGTYYAGQTRELRERMMEHREGLTKSTAGTNPKLKWFTIVDSREVAATLEVELKKLCDGNPREIRRRIIAFQDLMKEVSL